MAEAVEISGPILLEGTKISGPILGEKVYQKPSTLEVCAVAPRYEAIQRGRVIVVKVDGSKFL